MLRTREGLICKAYMVELSAVVRVIELHVTRPAVEDEGAGAGVVAEAGQEGVLALSVHGQPLDDALLPKVPGGDDGEGCRGRMREGMSSVLVG